MANPIAAASAWWTGHISAAVIQTNLVDPLNTALVPLLADTGWINITGLSSGWSNDTYIPQVRQIGNMVKFQGGLADSIFNSTSFLKVFSLPTGIAPPLATHVYPLFGPTGRGARILATGEVDFYANGASSFAYSLDGISYMVN